MSDEHTASVAGCYGNELARTPHLDSLAARGVLFEDAYTNSPLCGPARLSFTAAKYPSRIGAWTNSSWLPSADYPAVARAMNAEGYESVLCGKMHYDPTRSYGFREILPPDPRMRRAYTQRKTGRLRPRRRPDDETGSEKTSARLAEFGTGEDSPHMTRDRWVTERTVEFLSQRRATDPPFFFLAGYVTPHFPLVVPERFWEPFRGRIPPPQLPPGHVESQPLNYQHLRRATGAAGLDPETVRFAREIYYAATYWLDAQIGSVLEALRGSPVRDDTVVIYTSDHGENLGEHQLWWKNCMYEPAVRIPLVVSWPARWRAAQRRAGACSLVDLAVTIADLGAGGIAADCDGSSLVPWLEDPAYAWKDLAVSQYFGAYTASSFSMIRTGSHKYVYHARPDAEHPPERELYDLAADPGEFENLAREPAHAGLVARMHALLVEEMGEDPERAEQRCREEVARGYQRGDRAA